MPSTTSSTGELGQVFTAAQIVELGFTCASSMGLHRFIHTLDVFGTDDPVIAYGPDQVDTALSSPSEAEPDPEPEPQQATA